MILVTATARVSNDLAEYRPAIERRSYLPLVIAVFAVIPYSPLLLSGNLVLKDGMYSDYGSFQLPVREFVAEELSYGRFPHWLPWLGCGIPLHATQQVGICYPLLTPLYFVFNANMAIKAAIFLHIILCYWGQYRLGKQLKLSVAGSSIAGLICTQSGFLCAHLSVGHVTLVLAYALIPWLLSSVVEICESASLQGICRFAAVVGALLLTGHPQLPYYALLFGGIWATASLAVGVAASRRRAVATAFALGLAMGIAIAAVQILPTSELVRENRGDSKRGTAEYASTYNLNGLDLYQLVIPSLFGNQMIDIPEYMPPSFYHEKAGYLGILPLCFAILALFRGNSSRWPWGAAILIGFGLVVSLGDSTPVFPWLCATVPGLTWFRCPGRCLSVVSILTALLAGYGYDSFSQQMNTLSRRSEMGLAAIFISLALAVGYIADKAVVEINAARWTEFAKSNLLREFEASACAVISTMITCWLIPRFSMRTKPLIVAGLVVLDLGYFNLRCIQYEIDCCVRLTDESVAAIGTRRFIDGDTGFGSHEVRYSRCVAAAVRSESRMIGTNEGGVLPHGCEVLYEALSKNQNVTLRIAACPSIVKKNGLLDVSDSIQDNTLPRIWFCPTSLEHLLDKPIESITNADVDNMFAEATKTDIEVINDDSRRITIRLTPVTSGWLVVADTWYPGWKCRANDTDCNVVQAFNCFRRVPIEAGISSVDLRYEPVSFYTGVWISIIGIVFWLVISTLNRRRLKTMRLTPGVLSPSHH